jgi:hypothetical protein
MTPMQMKYKWYTLRFSEKIKDIDQLILARPFLTNSIFGFSRASSSERGQFTLTWRTSVAVQTIDQSGEPSIVSVDGVDQINFSVSDQKRFFLLRLESTKAFGRLLDALEEITGTSSTVAPIEMSMRAAEVVLSHATSTKLVGLKVSGAALNEDLVARLEFASKNGMTERKIGLLKGLRYKTEQATYEVLLQGLTGRISFNASGFVRLSGRLAPALLGALDRAACDRANT